MTIALWVAAIVYAGVTVITAVMALDDWTLEDPKTMPAYAAERAQKARHAAARRFRRAPLWPADFALLIKRVLADGKKETP